jgi:hypothetical protein
MAFAYRGDRLVFAFTVAAPDHSHTCMFSQWVRERFSNELAEGKYRNSAAGLTRLMFTSSHTGLRRVTQKEAPNEEARAR